MSIARVSSKVPLFLRIQTFNSKLFFFVRILQKVNSFHLLLSIFISGSLSFFKYLFFKFVLTSNYLLKKVFYLFLHFQ